MAEITGTVTLDGTALEGAKITVINDTQGIVESTATTAADGTYTATATDGDTVHLLMEYDDGTTQHNDYSKPFVVAEATGLPAPVGSPIHWYPMNEGSGTTLTDNVGTADGTINGPVWETGTWVGDSTLRADGVDDYVDAGANDGIGGEVAVAVTIQHRTHTGTYDAREFIASAGNANNTTSWEMGIFNGDNTLKVASWDGSHHVTSLPLSEIPADVPNRIVGQYDATAGEWQIYLNGSLVSATADATGAIANQATRVIFCQNSDGAIDYLYQGIVDDLVIYDRALTGQEITDDYARQPWGGA